jgi:hypothetical protein
MKKRPRDPNQLARFIVDAATGNAPPDEAKAPELTDAQKFARSGGLKGGRARAEKLSPELRAFIAKKAAKARWKKKK